MEGIQSCSSAFKIAAIVSAPKPLLEITLHRQASTPIGGRSRRRYFIPHPSNCLSLSRVVLIVMERHSCLISNSVRPSYGSGGKNHAVHMAELKDLRHPKDLTGPARRSAEWSVLVRSHPGSSDQMFGLRYRVIGYISAEAAQRET